MATGVMERESGVLSQAEQIASLPENLAILKMENENIMSLAAAHPRDMMQIKKDLESTLSAFPGLAEEAIYNKPVGKVVEVRCTCGNHFEQAVTKRNADFICPRCGNSSHDRKAISPPRQKFARGLSIRAAETLAEVYGFNKTHSGVSAVDADTVKIEATFIDYQRGRIWSDSTILSRLASSRDGGQYRISDDRFYGLTVKAEKSKLIREVVVRSVNAGLKAWFESRCEDIQSALLTDDAVEKIVKSFVTFNVTPEMLDSLIGRTRSQGWTANDRKTLLGVYTALKTNETTVAEVFYFDENGGDNDGKTRAKKSDLNEKLDAAKNGKKAADAKTAEAADAGNTTGADASGPATQQTEQQTGGATSLFADLKARIEANKSTGDWLKLKGESIDGYGRGLLTKEEGDEIQALLDRVKPPM